MDLKSWQYLKYILYFGSFQEVTQNANYEILKDRLGTIVVWERFPATAEKKEVLANGV